ncbi:tripartite tricarboxylate transporter TctB family protein [Vreelandella janggokensis]|uniref:Tripartite tricarboxylate transporter TctB family protein n=1 Tax=Vreelandella janggokensis TaxID=370767 RepID=A0ABT4IUI2_9GAMM|nr:MULTISPECIES: tripartite tricarboxylate transporter TctB family protein [Halomonas]MCW4150347.1 tripartite tricarboxylate transporter TctB family protein [Halomonas sp. 18H]MCZ0927324.1 tripartite tricarboxylate transporter TctB family protein [Halomonas janggokensis]MCZ0929832.1 tripartite tricarboxylate transporter TctB family protein [Halomonas janggokensis]MDR5885983.1 tripartite tricarboxylate transporter TctB family protein [Halomonas janggokensis]
MSIAADRVLGIALIGLAAFIAVQAVQLEIPFSYEPVGPKAFPLGLSILLTLLSLVMILRPGDNGSWPHKTLALRLLLVLVLLLVYAVLFRQLGFIVSSMLVVTALARLFDATWGKALITGIIMSIVGYFLFTAALGISLPSGYLFASFI